MSILACHLPRTRRAGKCSKYCLLSAQRSRLRPSRLLNWVLQIYGAAVTLTLIEGRTTLDGVLGAPARGFMCNGGGRISWFMLCLHFSRSRGQRYVGLAGQRAG